jgi:hypothetical protein
VIIWAATAVVVEEEEQKLAVIQLRHWSRISDDLWTEY